jgi:glyoxylase-like metal-dependent hydrolase (beta-lactamase superfamily II)
MTPIRFLVAFTLAVQVASFGGPGCTAPKPNYLTPSVDPGLLLPTSDNGAVAFEVTENIHAIMAGGYNSVLIQGDDSALLIDIGHDNAEVILAEVKALLGDKPLTHFMYGHVHHDHVAGAHKLREAYPEAVFVASKATVSMLERLQSPSRPFDAASGDIEIDTTETLEIGGAKYEFFTLVSHSDDNVVIRINDKVAFAADVSNPGSAPFFNFVFTAFNDVGLFRQDLVMIHELEWDSFISGHNNRLLTRDDLLTVIDYTDAVTMAAGMAFTKVDMGAVIVATGIDPMVNPYAGYRHYYEAVTAECSKDVIGQWKSGEHKFTPESMRIVDVMIDSHCWSAAWYQHMYAPGR